MSTWTTNDTWIVIIGVLCAIACALPGNFLVLRKMSMMGDAISHAVLPGIAAAFLLTASRDSFTMVIGAAVVGVLTALFTQLIHQWGKVDPGASMGVVFTTLFAIGLILIVRGADQVDLDPGCVLYGGIEFAPLDIVSIFGFDIPRSALVLGSMALINALFITIFYKELKISSFDPALATSLGINSTLMHLLLMVIVALTAVAAFEAVGSILVVAMLIVPAATAHLLTDRLASMIIVSAIVAAISVPLGHVMAIVTPSWFGFEGQSTNTAGMMAVALGGLFFVAMLAAPRHGVLSKLLHRLRLSLKIIREDILGFLYRIDELDQFHRERVNLSMMCEAIGCGRGVAWLALLGLRRHRLVGQQDRQAGYRLSTDGRSVATSLVRSHRLWETYLARHFNVPLDHVHDAAMQLEHVTDPAMQKQLAEEMQQPQFDPHGKRVPPQE